MKKNIVIFRFSEYLRLEIGIHDDGNSSFPTRIRV